MHFEVDVGVAGLWPSGCSQWLCSLQIKVLAGNAKPELQLPLLSLCNEAMVCSAGGTLCKS